jgi:hypothetical protein
MRWTRTADNGSPRGAHASRDPLNFPPYSGAVVPPISGGGWEAPLWLSLAGMCSLTAVRLVHQNPMAMESANRLVRGLDADPEERRSDRIQTKEVLSPPVQPAPT